MRRLPLESDRYPRAYASPLVEAVIELIHEHVWNEGSPADLSAAIESGQHPRTLVDRELMENVESTIVDSGYRFDWSAGISLAERPDIYRHEDVDPGEFSFEHPDAVVSAIDESGREQRGIGDNVVRYEKNVVGRARYIRTNEHVLDCLSNGVPPGTIAVIDDAGGTLTAPIIEHFAGVICAGGTVRSHLGILTREYGIACVMNARTSGIRDGDLVEIESSAAARTAEDYQENVDRFARIWRLTEGGE